MCVCQVIAILSLGQSTVSKHLFLLRAAGLIKNRRNRKWVHYSLDRGSDSPYAARRRPGEIRLDAFRSVRDELIRGLKVLFGHG